MVRLSSLRHHHLQMPVSSIMSGVDSQISNINSKINNLAQPQNVSNQFSALKGWTINWMQCEKIGPLVILTCRVSRTETWACKAWGTSQMLRIPDWLGAVHDTTIPAASNGSVTQGGNLYVTASRTHIDAFPAMDMELTKGRWVTFSLCWFAAS